MPPGETEPISITFDPKASGEFHEATFQFTTVISETVAPFPLGRMNVRSYAGQFNPQLPNLGENNTLTIEKLALGLSMGKTIVLANEGDASLDVEIVRNDGTTLNADIIRGEASLFF